MQGNAYSLQDCRCTTLMCHTDNIGLRAQEADTDKSFPPMRIYTSHIKNCQGKPQGFAGL